MTMITNADGKIWLAIKARLDQWTETAKMYQGEVFTPDSKQPFLIIQDVGLDTEYKAITTDCGESLQGIINVSVMAPLTWTYAQHKGLCGRVGDFLTASGRMVYQDAVVRFPDRPRVLGTPILDQAHNRAELQCPYRCWG
jgi:hypothetical protein